MSRFIRCTAFALVRITATRENALARRTFFRSADHFPTRPRTSEQNLEVHINHSRVVLLGKLQLPE